MKDGWPLVRLGEVLKESREATAVSRDRSYPNFGIYSFGRGAFQKPPIDGMQTSASTLYRAKAGQFVYSRLFAFEGAYALVPPELDGHFVSNEFPLFDCDPQRLDVRFMRYWICRKPTWLAIAESSTGMGSRRQRVQPEQLLRHQLPLPPLPEQRRIVARIECLAAKIAEAAALAASVEAECAATLSSLFRKLSEDAPRRPLGELAPLTRRPAKVDPTATYPQVSVRSFGRGSFHSGVLEGASITWEKPHLVLAGDILVSNIKAWEGAIAVAMPDDDGRYGSHRYLTFQPDKKLAAAEWLCHFLVSSEGLFYVGEASPGSADRNRTTSARAMCEIEIPVPSIETQSVFVTATKKIAALKQLQSQSAAELEALLPSILDRAFKGEL